MPLLHMSITAEKPESTAKILASFLGGRHLPFPPFPDSWIAFAAEDDGTAIEVYPTTHRLKPGENGIECITEEPDDATSFAHIAISSKLSEDQIIYLAMAAGWIARRQDRGPFACIEVWIDNRLLIEVLTTQMLADYRQNMRVANWKKMFYME